MNTTDHDLLLRIDEKVAQMHKSLFGNGKPGLVERTEVLESSRAFVLGAAKAVGIFVGTTLTVCGVVIGIMRIVNQVGG